MKQISFGLVGCGFIGKTHAAVIQSLPNAVLGACCDKNEAGAKAFAEEFSCKCYTDYDDLLADPTIDAVVICLPSGLHCDATIAAAKAGKHILCEKPIDIEVSRAQQMVDAAREANVKFSVIMQHRFDTALQLVQKSLKDGTLGEILWGASRTIWYRNEEYFNNPWRGRWAFDGGGALINQSVHYIDLLLCLMGDVESLSAKCRTRHHDIETEDVGVANLAFTSGAIGTIEGTTVAFPGHYAEISLFCENGTVIIRNEELLSYSLKSGTHPAFEAILNPEKANMRNESPDICADSHKKQYEDFLYAICNDCAPSVTGDDALRSLRVIKAIYESSQQKQEVYL